MGDKVQASMWGVGPVAPLHFGLDPLMAAQRDILADGYSHTVLLADLHAMMSHRLSVGEVRRRATYYESVLAECYGLDCAYALGSDFQLSDDYVRVLLGLASRAELSRVRSALSGASRESTRFDRISVASLLYPLMQLLDVPFLGKSLVIADSAQRRVYDLGLEGQPLFTLLKDCTSLVPHARELQFVYQVRYVDLLVDIRGMPLNKSTAKTRLSVHENSDSLRAKIMRMYAPPAGQVPVDGRRDALLAYVGSSVFPWVACPVTVHTRDGDVKIKDFPQLVSRYSEGVLHPNDLKTLLVDVIDDRISKFAAQISRSAYSWLDLARVRES